MSYFQEGLGNENLYDEFHLDNFLLPQLQDSDGKIQKMDAYEDSQILYEQQMKSYLESLDNNYYAVRVDEDYSTTYSAYQETVLCDEEMNRNTLGEALESWFRITIPNGRKYNKTWLINLLQSFCSMGFTPVDFQYIKNSVQFSVQSVQTAVELMNLNYQISDEENKKISIYVNSSSEPASVLYKLTPAQMYGLKLSMKKRYDISRKSLYLRKLHFDKDLMDRGIDIFLNRRSCMTATLQIIQEDFPELVSLNVSNNKICRLDGLSELIEKAPHVKILNLSVNLLRTAQELEKLKGLKLEQLWLEGNPLCNTFPDCSSYISTILNYFPELSHLDGRKLFPKIYINNLEMIKPRKESYTGSESLKNLIVQFMLQYYLIYDYGDRHSLLNAYHADACFSLAITYNSDKADLSSLEDYLKDNRNMKILKNSILQMQMLKHKKYNIVTYLQEMPKTQHDLNSYVVDLCVQTEKMICFSVNGVFKEVEEKSWGCVRAFTRTFILTPDSEFGLCIVNDEMILRNASPAETRKVFSTTKSTRSYTQSCWNTHTDLKHFENTWKCVSNDEALFTFQTEERLSSDFFGYKF